MRKKELFVSHPCQHPIVILKDVKYKDLLTIVHFMYYGIVNVLQEELDSILKVREVSEYISVSNI